MEERTGVAKYLAKVALSTKADGATATGVDRYLAKQQAFLLTEDNVETLTGVAKYLRNAG